MNKELLYSFDDTLEIFFSRNDWSGETKQRKKNISTKLLQSFDLFLKYFTINNLPSPFLTQRGLVYFMSGLILRECYTDTDVLLISFFQTIKIPTVIKPNLSTENAKLYENVFHTYQCGVWCSFFVNVCAEYLKNYKNSVNKSESIEFLKFLSSYLIEKKIKLFQQSN